MPLSGQTMSVTNTYTPGAVITASGFNTNFTDFATSLTTIATTLQGDLDANGQNIGFDNLTGIEDDSGNEQLLFQKVASAVNFVRITNAATGNTPFFGANGDDTNVGLGLTSKGTGGITLYSGTVGRTLAQFTDTASSVNFFSVAPNATANGPIFAAAGSDTNVDVNISSKGTGTVTIWSGNVARRLTALADIASSVNYVQIFPSATGNPCGFSAQGSDTNISVQINGKGTGGVMLEGTATNDNAAAGYVGEYISSTVLVGSGVALTSTTAANVTSIDLTAGDWDVDGSVWMVGTGTTNFQAKTGAVSLVSATVPTAPGAGAMWTELHAGGTVPGTTPQGFPTGKLRVSVAATTTVYLVALSNFTVSTNTAYGFIGARRVR